MQEYSKSNHGKFEDKKENKRQEVANSSVTFDNDKIRQISLHQTSAKLQRTGFRKSITLDTDNIKLVLNIHTAKTVIKFVLWRCFVQVKFIVNKARHTQHLRNRN